LLIRKARAVVVAHCWCPIAPCPPKSTVISAARLPKAGRVPGPLSHGVAVGFVQGGGDPCHAGVGPADGDLPVSGAEAGEQVMGEFGGQAAQAAGADADEFAVAVGGQGVAGSVAGGEGGVEDDGAGSAGPTAIATTWVPDRQIP
jgi:hypothetical protein